LTTEYEQVNDNFRMLADIRFKLLALLPALAGAAIYVLSHIAVSVQGAQKTVSSDIERETYDYGTVLLISVLGFVATFGITLYDQRNTTLYNALVGRAKVLERLIGLADGQFTKRPERGRRVLGMVAGHDTGLALIYASVLGAWFFPIVYASVAWIVSKHPLRVSALYTALFSALLMGIVFFEEFLRLDSASKKKPKPLQENSSSPNQSTIPPS
jgi:hypothetical protein